MVRLDARKVRFEQHPEGRDDSDDGETNQGNKVDDPGGGPGFFPCHAVFAKYEQDVSAVITNAQGTRVIESKERNRRIDQAQAWAELEIKKHDQGQKQEDDVQ